MKKFAALAISVLAISATAAKADDYAFIGSDKSLEAIYFLDITSIKDSYGGLHTAWSVMVFNGSQIGSFKFMKTLDRFDCNSDTAQTLAYYLYGDDSNVVGSSEIPQSVKHVIPETNQKLAADIICAGTDRTKLYSESIHEDLDPVAAADLLYSRRDELAK